MNLLKALAAVSSLTLVSRILAFVRDILIARIFGAGMANDAYVIATRLPNMLRRLFAEGAFSQAFVPIFGEYNKRRGHDDTKLLVDHVTTLLALALFVVTLIGIVAAPLIIYITAPGFVKDTEKFNLTVHLLRITSPYIFFISLVSVAAGILNTYNKFWVPAVAPILLNVCLIGGALWIAPYFDQPIVGLAWAWFIAGFVQLAFQIPFLKKIGMMPSFRFSLKDEGMRRVIRQMGPAVFGVSIAQISLIINTVFASFLVAGSVSWLYYADRLMEFPSGLLGAALGTILLPSLSKHYADNSSAEYSKLLDWGLRLVFMLTLPAALALGMIAVPLLATFFQHGAAGHQNPGQDRHRHPDRHTTDECAVYIRAGIAPCGSGALYRSRRLLQFRNPVLFAAQARYLPTRARVGQILSQVVHCLAGAGIDALVRHGQRTALAHQPRLDAHYPSLLAGGAGRGRLLCSAVRVGLPPEGFCEARSELKSHNLLQ